MNKKEIITKMTKNQILMIEERLQDLYEEISNLKEGVKQNKLITKFDLLEKELLQDLYN